MSTTSNSPFLSATLKLQRAKNHLDEMERTKQQITHARPKQFVTGQSPDGKFFVTGMLDDRMPEEFSLVVGDAVHNLRSALDHSAVALATLPIGTNSVQSKTKVYFPASAGDRNSFQQILRSQMPGASPAAHTLVSSLEPFPGGANESIYELHGLDIDDKHKLLLATISRMTIKKLEYGYRNQVISLKAHDFNYENTNFHATFTVPGASPNDLQFLGFVADFDVVFADGQPLAGKVINDSLISIHQVIEEFIARCERQLL